MAEDFDNFSKKIVTSIRRQNLNQDVTNNFLSYISQIIEQKLLSSPNSEKTEQFLNNTVPKVASTLTSSLQMNATQLQFSIQLMDCLNTLALWAMLNNNEKLINDLLAITNSNASYYVKNHQQPTLFADRFHNFMQSPLFEQLNEMIESSTEKFQIPVLFSIYAFILQYCSSLDSNDDDAMGIALTYPMKFCDFVAEIDDDTFAQFKSSILVTIMNSLYKIYPAYDLFDAIPVFIVFLSRCAKCEDFEKQLTALQILNNYASSTDPQVVEAFDEWKSETDVVSTIINIDLHLEILQNSKELIRKVIQDEEVFGFLVKSEESYIIQRYFLFRLIAQIMVERFDKDTIIELILELPRTPIDIEYLIFLLIELFQTNDDEKLTACEDIVEIIFSIGEENPEEITPKMILYFKELNAIDQKRNNPNITLWRINVLGRYVQTLSDEGFNDKTCIFLTEQFEELRRVSLLQPSTTPFAEILKILDDALDKAQNHYLMTGNVSEALIRLFYMLVLFRNIKFIIGEPNHIQIREPSNYEFFDYALAALSYTNDPSIADTAIELFSQFFSQTVFFPESITILYNFCLNYLGDDIEPMAKYRVLKLIYKVLLDLEGDYELIDFENRRRNHRSDTRGKDKIKVVYGETDFDIYAKPNSKVSQLIDRIAMRLLGTADMIEITDSNKKNLNPSHLVRTLSQPLSVICKNNYKQVKYSSASFALWNRSFTTTLLQILDNSSNPELTHITKKLLAFLPCDHTIMHSSVDEYLQMINDAQSDEKFKYLLHCINHFTPNIKKEIGEKIENIWATIKSKTNCLSAIFEFFLCILNDENSREYPMFIGGRVFRALYLHDKKAYEMATELYTKTLTKYINVNDQDLLKKMLINCEDDEWPYLKSIFQTFQEKEPIFTACIEEVSNSKLEHKYVIKLLAMYVKEVMSSTDKIEPFLDNINTLDNCDPDELIDVMRVITDLNIIKSREHFQNHQEELNKMITLAFKKGSLDAEELILNFYRQFETIQTQSTTNILRQFFDQKFDVWGYKSSEHIQSKLGIGLQNLQGTSYMNSLFQVFNQIPQFMNEIFASSEPKLQSLQWILASLQKSIRDYIDPTKFVSEWSGGWNGQNVDPKVEHDVTEFFHYIMYDCPESAKDLFRGEQTIDYAGENFEKQATEQFFSIPVKVKGYTNLVQSINSLLEPEIISDFDDGDGNKIAVSKLMKITKCPKILVVQLRRFEFDPERQRNVKINQRFEFPEHLNIISLLKEEKNTYYSLHSIICSDNQGNSFYTLLHKEKNYHKIANIFKSNDEEWIRIADRTITELPNSYKEEAFGGRPNSQNDLPGNAYLLFYVLDEFIAKTENTPVEIQIGEDLYNTIQKENEVFGTMQTLFSVEVAKFLQQSPSKDSNIYYLYNILMHGTNEFQEYINDITKNIDYQTAIGYTDQNFSNFQAIFEKEVPESLLKPFIDFACTMMEKKESVQILRRILDVLTIDQIAEQAITPLLKLVYSYLKTNGAPEDPFDIINKLVDFIRSCITQNLTPSIKIDNAFLSLAELLKWGKTNKDRLHNSCDLKPIEENYQFIEGHLENVKSLHDFVEQAVKYDLMDIKYFFDLKDIDDQKLANVLSEQNHLTIGRKYPDKISDILSIINAEWEPERLKKFAYDMYPDGILDKDKQPFVTYFLTNNFYKNTEDIIKVISNSPENVEILEKIIQINSIQTEGTYKHVLDCIKTSKNENEILSLIKMYQFLVRLAKAREFFEVVFSNTPNDEIIIPRFEAFVEATGYAGKNEIQSILESEIYKKHESTFMKSPSFNTFNTRI